MKDIESILAKMESFKRPEQLASADVFICTEQTFSLIKRGLDEIQPDRPVDITPSELFGVMFEVYPTINEAVKRCMELREQGRKACYLTK